MNRLAHEKSAYLRHAAHQKIDWHPWSEAPFEKARAENKPVFLSSGAVWCHWCHVMAKESFEDEEVAKILNDRFVAIKLDRDERPDIDKRYQRALAVMGASGGWPLSLFLTPEKEVFYGGTYFPPREQFGRPAFKTILTAIAQLYTEKRSEVKEQGGKITEFLKSPRDRTVPAADIDQGIVEHGLRAISSEMDTLNGGFGSAPKFPMSGAIELLLNRYFFTRDESLGTWLRKTLTAMARGGFYDQLGGGFHRYSTDEAWFVPHFEKMTDDNAWLLRNYADASVILGDSLFGDVALGTGHFMMKELADPDGGFYASQDADVTPDDEGGYFTWTDAEFRQILGPDEYAVLSLHFFHERGVVHHDPSKKVLCVAADPEEISRTLDLDVDAVRAVVGRGRERLLRAREEREKPFVDKALYTSLNGMAISAFLRAFRAFGNEDLKAFGLKSLDRILDVNISSGQLYHCQGVRAMLDDYIALIDALIGAYEVTGLTLYRDRAEALMGVCRDRFWDKERGGFFDTEEEVIGMRLKGVEDSPHPSGNGLAVLVLTRLSSITGNNDHLRQAELTLKAFSADAGAMGVHAGYYLCGLDGYFNVLKLDVHALPDSELAQAAIFTFHPYTTIVYGDDRGCIIPCLADRCLEPLSDPQALGSFLQQTSF
jgi:uncharacterized protein